MNTINSEYLAKDCFHRIYVDLCKKGTHSIGTCSLEEGIQILCDSTTPEWLKQKPMTITIFKE